MRRGNGGGWGRRLDPEMQRWMRRRRGDRIGRRGVGKCCCCCASLFPMDREVVNPGSRGGGRGQEVSKGSSVVEGVRVLEYLSCECLGKQRKTWLAPRRRCLAEGGRLFLMRAAGCTLGSWRREGGSVSALFSQTCFPEIACE